MCHEVLENSSFLLVIWIRLMALLATCICIFITIWLTLSPLIKACLTIKVKTFNPKDFICWFMLKASTIMCFILYKVFVFNIFFISLFSPMHHFDFINEINDVCRLSALLRGNYNEY